MAGAGVRFTESDPARPQQHHASALRCCAGLDAGGIYNKQPLSLHGSAEEIFLRADSVIEQMIEQIVSEEPAAIPQQGDPVIFNRRTPAQSNLASCPKGDPAFLVRPDPYARCGGLSPCIS